MPTASSVLGQCFLCSVKTNCEIPWSTWKYSQTIFSVFPPSALEVDLGQASAKTNLSFTAVEILKPYQILKLCHSSAVITCLPQDLLMAVEVLIHQGAQIIEAIHLLQVLPLCLYCDYLLPCDICQWCHTSAISLLDLLRTVLWWSRGH